jgi:Polysaccharide pyruvyl transferase
VPLTVHHYYPLGSENVGDHMVARAIRQDIPRHFGPCDFVDFPVNDRYRGDDRTIGLRDGNVRQSNAQADLVIVGGSNLLEPRASHFRNLHMIGRWSIFTTVDDIRSLTPPLLLMGMGTGSSFGKPIRKYFSPALDELRALHTKAFASAVRDITTVRHLKRVGIHTQCTGCPVTFLTDRPIIAGKEDDPLLISFPPIGITARPFGKAFIRKTMKYVRWLRDRRVPVIVTLHDSRDREPARDLVPKGVEIFYTTDLDEQIARFESSRGVIGFRLHAALLGIGVGKMVIPVGLDWRGIGLIETLDAHALSIRADRIGHFAKLRMLTDKLLSNDRGMIDHLAGKKSHFQALHEKFLANAASQYRQITGSRSLATEETVSNAK